MPGRAPSLPRDARLLLAGVAIDAFGTGLTLPFFVVYLREVRGFPLETIGLLAGVPAGVALLLLGPLGVVVDRLGPRRVQMGALAGAAAGALLLSRGDTVPLVFVARVLTGIGHAAFWPANQALVAAMLPSTHRQRYFGISFALLNAGIGVGGIAGGTFVDPARPTTFEILYRFDAVTFLVPLVLLALPLRHVGGPAAGSASPDGSGSYRAVLSDPVFRRFLAFAFVSAFVGYGQIEAGWTAYANVVARVSPRTIGFAFAVNTAVIVALQLPALRVIAGRRRTRMLVVLAVLWGISWAIMGLAARVAATPLAAWLLVGSFGLFALGETVMSPTSPAILNDIAPEALRGRYNAASGFAFQLAAIAGPAIAGVLLGAGHAAAFIGMLVAGCGVVALAALRLERALPPHANGVGSPGGPRPSADAMA